MKKVVKLVVMRINLEVVTQLTNQNAGRRTQKKKAGKQTQRHKTERRKNMDILHQKNPPKTNIEKHQVFFYNFTDQFSKTDLEYLR